MDFLSALIPVPSSNSSYMAGRRELTKTTRPRAEQGDCHIDHAAFAGDIENSLT